MSNISDASYETDSDDDSDLIFKYLSLSNWNH